MDFFSFDKSLSIVVVDQSSGVRPLMTEALRSFGFEKIISVDSLAEVLKVLSSESLDWIITSAFLDGKVNLLQLLRLIHKEPELHKLKVSVFLADEELFVLNRAFALGLFTWHSRPFNKVSFTKEIDKVNQHLTAQKKNASLVAADYFRPIINKNPIELLCFEQALNLTFPDNAELMLNLAEANFITGNHTSARTILWQAVQLDESLQPKITEMGQKYGKDALFQEGGSAVEIKTCVVVEPDTTVQTSINELLLGCGAKEIQMFSDGLSYWEWQTQNEQPDLIIMEWKVPKLSAPLIIQRLKSEGHNDTTIIIHSSLVKKADEPLIKEMGVTEVIRKPFRKDQMLNCVMGAVNQSVRPTDIRALERKILGLLHDNNVAEASNYMRVYTTKFQGQDGQRKYLEAEFAFATKNYRDAKELAITAIHLGNKSVILLNLLGKSLMKLRDFPAALNIFNKANNIAPNSISRLCAIAETQEEMGNADAAIATLGNATQLDADNQDVINSNVNIGLSTGNTEMVQKSIDKFRPTENVLSFINNRAIAHSKSGKFEEGIKLYQNALTALPEDKGKTRSIVLYNLALAFARKNDLKSVVDTLENLSSPEDAGLKRKMASLLKRSKEAIQGGGSIVLVAEIPLDESEQSDGGNSSSSINKQNSIISLFNKLDPKKVSACLADLYVDQSPSNDLIDALLSTVPSFQLRKNVIR